MRRIGHGWKGPFLFVGVLVIGGLAQLFALQVGIRGLQGFFVRRGANVPRTRVIRTACPAAWAERFSGRPGPSLESASVIEGQDIPAGVTPDGSSILIQRGGCSTNLATLIIDEVPPGSGAYRTYPIRVPGMDLGHEEAVTMEEDGLTIIGMRADELGFRAAKRFAVGEPFNIVTDDEFRNIVGTAPEYLWAPCISPDGLAFYYSVVGDPDPSVNGIYESVRPVTNVPFSRGKRMPAVVQSLAQYVNGVSADHLSIFLELRDDVEGGYGTVVLTRTSDEELFENPNAPNPPPRLPGLRTRPFGGCDRLIGSCAPRGGGCRGEDVCTWSVE